MDWFKRHFGRQDYTSDQARFAELHTSLGRPPGMVMLLATTGVDHVVYIRLPEITARGEFPNYGKVEGPPREGRIEGLFGSQADLLEFIERKSCS